MRLLIMFLVMVHSYASFAQENKVVSDTLPQRTDTIPSIASAADTIPAADTSAVLQSSDMLEAQVIYSAQGYIRRDVVNKIVVLVDAAKVNYGNIEITADSIRIDMNSNVLFAVGRQDTSETIKGSPVFKEGSQEIAASDLTYNFRTKRALASKIETKQSEGLLRSQTTKLLEDGTSNISRSTYSTCDADPPHFYIRLPRARIYPGEKLVSGPGNLVLEGIPLPLFLPFAYFPINTSRQASGLIIPHFGQETQRGYNLTDGGYYFAISDYFDLAIRGSVYANGTWMSTAQSNYIKRYKYSGNFSFSYANNVSGHKGLDDYSSSPNYRVGWTFNQDPKASPGSRFAASVNMSSSGFDRANSYQVTEHVTTQRQSSVSYSRTWEGTPFNFSASMNHTQDVRRKTVNLNLPKANFNMNRIYPLKPRNAVGESKWWQDIQFSYSAQLDNRISTYDSLFLKKEMWNNMNNGFSHQIPVSLQIRPFKNFSISPSLTYNGVLYTERVQRFWDADLGDTVRVVIKGASYGHAVNPAISAAFNPQMFGYYRFKNQGDRRLEQVRHVMRPSVSFSYVPYLSGFSSRMYRQVQINPEGAMAEYSIYENGLYGTPSLASRSGNIAFSLANIIEAKVFARDDTTGKAQKVKVIDNLGISTSYNIFADAFNWAPITVGARTTLANNINISGSSSFSMYGIDEAGKQVNNFVWKQNGKLLRMTNVGLSIDASISDLFKGKEDKSTTTATPNALTGGVQNTNPTNSQDLLQTNLGSGLYDEYGYAIFDVPWTMNMSFNINYSKPGLTSFVTSAMTLGGSISITKKMSATYTTGYDFKGKQITMTNIGISRDLHCWQMNFNWVPNGTLKMWNFTIRVKASVLGDLKYERRKDFHDQF